MSADIQQRGAELVVVGSGSVAQAGALQAEQQLPFPLLTDPTLESYRRAELRHGLKSTFGPRVALRAIQAFRQGYRQSATQGAPLQQGGVFVIAPGDRLLFAYVSREAGDHPAPEAILRALDAGEPSAAGARA